MAMRDADKDRRKNPYVKNTNPPAKEPLSYHELKQLLMNARANAVQWEQCAKENQEAAFKLTQVQQDIQTYQIEVHELKERAGHNYQIYLNEQKNYQQALSLYNEEKTRAIELIVQRDEWQQRAKENQEAASKLTQVQQNIYTYQVEINELKERIAHNYLIYLEEQENYQQALNRYNEAKAKATELIAQRDEWQQRSKENEEAVSQLTQVQQDIQTYQVEVNELKESAAQNYQRYIDEQKNYQQALHRYNEEKARAAELLAQYEEMKSERDNYLTLYNEAQTQLKFERRSKAGIKGWETRRKAENERLKREIAEMVILLRESLSSKDEAINNLYIVAERMDRIQSLVDSVEEETTGNPIGLVQKFKRIWLAIKEILSE
jgi:L-rhamnose mutarotase